MGTIVLRDCRHYFPIGDVHKKLWRYSLHARNHSFMRAKNVIVFKEIKTYTSCSLIGGNYTTGFPLSTSFSATAGAGTLVGHLPAPINRMTIISMRDCENSVCTQLNHCLRFYSLLGWSMVPRYAECGKCSAVPVLECFPTCHLRGNRCQETDEFYISNYNFIFIFNCLELCVVKSAFEVALQR